ncbi:MAG: hypothetical protein QW057_10915 [Candidatus Bathyarchaeia archaeon]
MRRLPSYEYLVSRVRARVSSLFDRASYRAVLGSSSPLEAVFTLKQSRFVERLGQPTATDYLGIARWLTADFLETFDFTEENAPRSIRPFLGKLRDLFTAVFVSRLLAGKRGVQSPIGQAAMIPSTRKLYALGLDARPEALLQGFSGEEQRAQAEELFSFAAQQEKVFPLLALPAFAARSVLLFVDSVNGAEFGGLKPLLDAVSAGSLMVASAASKAEGGDLSLFAERFRSALRSELAPAAAEAAPPLSEAERRCWGGVAPLARNCLIGYPFRARTVAGFLFLEWFDIVNWRLALLALQGVLTVQEADRAFIIA